MDSKREAYSRSRPLASSCGRALQQHEAELAYAAYLASDPNGDVHFEIDGKRRLVPSPSTNDAVLALRRDGVARIADWGVLTDSIEKKATRSLQGSRKTLSSTSNGRVATARYADKRLERFFRSINDIASGYLGDAQLSGYKVVHICVETQPPRQSDTREDVASMAAAWGAVLISTQVHIGRPTTRRVTWRASGTTTASGTG